MSDINPLKSKDVTNTVDVRVTLPALVHPEATAASGRQDICRSSPLPSLFLFVKLTFKTDG